MGGTPAEKPYSDIGLKHWAVASIDEAKQKGMLDYITSDKFQPKKGLTRAEAVEILSKTEFGKQKIADLLNWEKGFGKYVVEQKSSPVFTSDE